LPLGLCPCRPKRRKPIPTDTSLLIGIGLVGIVIAWMVFSLVKKMLGLALLGALLVAGFYLWSNPELLQSLIITVLQFVNAA
jgi:hypothetical protein